MKKRLLSLLLVLAMVRAVANRPPKVAVVRRNAHRIVMPTRPSNRTATNNYADRIKTPVLMTGVFYGDTELELARLELILLGNVVEIRGG